MENPLHNKVVLYGGGAALAIVAGLFIYGSIGNANAAPAPAATTLDNYGGLAPVTYSSGTGTVPIDSAGSDTGGQSSLNYLSGLLDLQKYQSDQTAAYQDKSLNIAAMLGKMNIASTEKINLRNTDASLAMGLGGVASAIAASVVNAKATAAVSGQINGGGQHFDFTVEQLTGNSAWNKPLINVQGGGITLADGRVVKG